MSEESRYRRFLAPKPSFTAAELAYLTEIDHHDHEALIAIEPQSGEPVGRRALRAGPPHSRRSPRPRLQWWTSGSIAGSAPPCCAT